MEKKEKRSVRMVMAMLIVLVTFSMGTLYAGGVRIPTAGMAAVMSARNVLPEWMIRFAFSCPMMKIALNRMHSDPEYTAEKIAEFAAYVEGRCPEAARANCDMSTYSCGQLDHYRKIETTEGMRHTYFSCGYKSDGTALLISKAEFNSLAVAEFDERCVKERGICANIGGAAACMMEECITSDSEDCTSYCSGGELPEIPGRLCTVEASGVSYYNISLNCEVGEPSYRQNSCNEEKENASLNCSVWTCNAMGVAESTTETRDCCPEGWACPAGRRCS